MNHPTRFDPEDNYFQVAYPGKVMPAHSHDLNDMQMLLEAQITSVGNVILSDGKLVAGGTVIHDSDTGAVTVEEALVYIKGKVHKVAAASFTVPVNQPVSIGVYLTKLIVTAQEDADLKGQIPTSYAYGRAGADRIKITAVWGYEGDGQTGDYYHVTSINDGVLQQQTPPPQLNPLNTAIARYDREANGNYVVNGFNIIGLGFDDGEQVFSIQEGTANVWGEKIIYNTSQRLRITEDPDIEQVDAEPHAIPSNASGNVQIFLNHAPVTNIDHVILERRVTENITHGSHSGVKDPLAHTGVANIISVEQSGTSYVAGTDFILFEDQIDWTPSGAEPSPGSTYEVVYTYLDTTTPISYDSTSITVDDVEPGSNALVGYDFALARIDSIVMDRDGLISYITGQSQRYDPFPPQIPHDTLRLADVVNRWGEKPNINETTTHSIHFNELQSFGKMIGDLQLLLAGERLRRDMDSRQPTTKRGVFVDPFFDDDMRDQGLPQTAAIIDETLQLPINASADTDTLQDDPLVLPYIEETLIEQTLCTQAMKINPYQAFEPLPAAMTITPVVDRFVEFETQWTSPITRQITQWRQTTNFWAFWLGGLATQGDEQVTSTTQTVGRRRRQAAFLRQIEIEFSIEGFGAGENLESLTIDGVEVTPVAS